MATISGIAVLPAPYVGAYMSENEDLGPDKTFLTSILIGLGVSVFFMIAVKDSQNKKGENSRREIGQKK